MKKIIYLLLLLLLLGGGHLYAQSAADTGGIVVHIDPRLALVTKKHVAVVAPVIRSGRGYRVQIYSGNDRLKAMQVKTDFLRRFPGVRTYMIYVQPQFRVKAGDFRTRQEAAKLYQQINNLYSPCMIVPDNVEMTNRNDD